MASLGLLSSLAGSSRGAASVMQLLLQQRLKEALAEKEFELQRELEEERFNRETGRREQEQSASSQEALMKSLLQAALSSASSGEGDATASSLEEAIRMGAPSALSGPVRDIALSAGESARQGAREERSQAKAKSREKELQLAKELEVALGKAKLRPPKGPKVGLGASRDRALVNLETGEEIAPATGGGTSGDQALVLKIRGELLKEREALQKQLGAIESLTLPSAELSRLQNRFSLLSNPDSLEAEIQKTVSQVKRLSGGSESQPDRVDPRSFSEAELQVIQDAAREIPPEAEEAFRAELSKLVGPRRAAEMLAEIRRRRG